MGISKLPGIQPCGRVRWVRVQAASEQSNGVLKNIISWTHDHVHKTAISLSDSCTIILRRPSLGTSRFTSLRTQTPLRTPTTQRHLCHLFAHPMIIANPIQNTTEPFGGVEAGWHEMLTFAKQDYPKDWKPQTNFELVLQLRLVPNKPEGATNNSLWFLLLPPNCHIYGILWQKK